MLETFLIYLKIGCRQFIKEPMVTLSIFLTLVLGIGINIAIFSVVSGYLFKPLPYVNADELVSVSEVFPEQAHDSAGMSLPLYQVLSKDDGLFQSAALYDVRGFTIRSKDATRFEFGASVTPTLFRVLGVQPILGRMLTVPEGLSQAPREVILSYALWHDMYHADKSIIGSVMLIKGQNYEVVGVMPKQFVFPQRKTMLWMSMQSTIEAYAEEQLYHTSAFMVARLNQAGSGQMASRLDLALNRISSSQPELAHALRKNRFQVDITPLKEKLVSDHNGTLLAIQVAAILVLLVTCANVSSLLLVRILGRGHEIAMRATLGATGFRLAFQITTEVLCISAPAGLVAATLSWWLLAIFSRSGIGPGERVFSLTPDWRVGLFAVVLVLLVSVVISLIPLWRVRRIGLSGLLGASDSRGGDSGAAKKIRKTLVVGEIALATLLLVGGSVLVTSFVKLQSIDPGFTVENIESGYIVVPPGDPNLSSLDKFYAQIQSAFRQIPGVIHSGMTDVLPFTNSRHVASIQLRSRPDEDGLHANIQTADAAFFVAMGMPVLQGRSFRPGADGKMAGSVVVSQYFAEHILHAKNPVGKQLQISGRGEQWFTIVGVVPTVKIHSLDEEVDYGTIYTPMDRSVSRGIGFVVQTSIPPGSLTAQLRQKVHDLDPSVALFNLDSLSGRLQDTLQRRRAVTQIVAAFSITALILAMIGVYGMLGYSIRKDRVAYGIRMALGATPWDLHRLVLLDGIRLLAMGLLFGILLVAVFGHTLTASLPLESVFAPVPIIISTLVLVLMTLFATWLPARLASHLDPVTAIRDIHPGS